MTNAQMTVTKSRQEIISDIVDDMTGEMMQICRKLEELYITRNALSDEADIGLMDEYIGSLEDQIRLVKAIGIRKIVLA